MTHTYFLREDKDKGGYYVRTDEHEWFMTYEQFIKFMKGDK